MGNCHGSTLSPNHPFEWRIREHPQPRMKTKQYKGEQQKKYQNEKKKPYLSKKKFYGEENNNQYYW